MELQISASLASASDAPTAAEMAEDPFAVGEQLTPRAGEGAAAMSNIIMCTAPAAVGDSAFDNAAMSRAPFGAEVNIALIGMMTAIAAIMSHDALFAGASQIAILSAFGPEQAPAVASAIDTLARVRPRTEPLALSDQLAEQLVEPIVTHAEKYPQGGDRDATWLSRAILAERWKMPAEMIARAVKTVEQRHAEADARLMAGETF